jgi:RNA-directed DNA polymerase
LYAPEVYPKGRRTLVDKPLALQFNKGCKMSTSKLIEKWRDKELKILDAKKRRYLHFDPRINFKKSQNSLIAFFQKGDNVAKHAFYPFIKASLITPRYKKTDSSSTNEKVKRTVENKERPIMYAGHFDSFIYSWYSTLLTAKYESKIKENGIYECVLAYVEKSKSNIDFAYEAFTEVKTRGNCATIALDVKGFFDNLDHEYLKKMWCEMIGVHQKLPVDHYNVYHSITKFSYVEFDALKKALPNVFHSLELKSKKTTTHPVLRLCSPQEFRDTIRNQKLIKKNQERNKIEGSQRFGELCGIPQGSPISATLSNIYMFEFDIRMKAFCDSTGAKYMRYSDDILFITQLENIDKTLEKVTNEISTVHLMINESKTEITIFKPQENGELVGSDRHGKPRNMQYLGFEFDGNNAFIRSSSFSKYHGRMSARIRENLKAAYGNNQIGDVVFKKKLYNRYTQKGNRNFISYAMRAAEKMESKSIEDQYKNSLAKVKKKLVMQKQKFEDKRKITKIKR